MGGLPSLPNSTCAELQPADVGIPWTLVLDPSRCPSRASVFIHSVPRLCQVPLATPNEFFFNILFHSQVLENTKLEGLNLYFIEKPHKF